MKLSELFAAGTFEPVVLSRKSDTWNDYPFLKDDMKEQARQWIEDENEKRKANWLPAWDAETLSDSSNYSLSCSQGDGVSFRKGSTEWKTIREGEGQYDFLDVRFTIKTNSFSHHYTHERTFEVIAEYDGEETEEEFRKFEKEAEEATEDLRDICGRLEKYGYDIIESEDRAEVARQITQFFFDKYDIREDACESIYESEYGSGKVYIGEIEGYEPEIYLPDFELTLHTTETLEDGKKTKESEFYTA